MEPERLALYGTLRPGGDAHFQIRDVSGVWLAGTVRGWTYDITWGPGEGYPGITLDAAGNGVEVDVLESAELGRHWSRLDHYEGPGYTRSTTDVTLTDGRTVKAQIYETVPDAD
jgi:gamma-glutamylcyclotransferase (GGCT)/AIG2-like uncharacterized protein YtfP